MVLVVLPLCATNYKAVGDGSIWAFIISQRDNFQIPKRGMVNLASPAEAFANNFSDGVGHLRP